MSSQSKGIELADEMQLGKLGELDTLYLLAIDLQHQIEILKKVYKGHLAVLGAEAPSRAVLLFAILDTCDSMHKLVVFRKTRDFLVLSRCVFETFLNYFYIAASGRERDQELMAHASQKAWRDLYRELRTTTYRLKLYAEGADQREPSKQLQEALEAYTTARGKEKTKWTDDNIEARLNKVCDSLSENVALTLGFLLLMSYRHGSEVSHGTVAGSVYVLGVKEGVLDDPEEEEQRIRSYQNALMSVILLFCIDLASEVVADVSTIDESIAPLCEEASKVKSSSMLRMKVSESAEVIE